MTGPGRGCPARRARAVRAICDRSVSTRSVCRCGLDRREMLREHGMVAAHGRGDRREMLREHGMVAAHGRGVSAVAGSVVRKG